MQQKTVKIFAKIKQFFTAHTPPERPKLRKFLLNFNRDFAKIRMEYWSLIRTLLSPCGKSDVRISVYI